MTVDTHHHMLPDFFWQGTDNALAPVGGLSPHPWSAQASLAFIFACVPLPAVDAALEELSYAFDVLRLDGCVLFTNSNGPYLGDAALEPFFQDRACCERSSAPHVA